MNRNKAIRRRQPIVVRVLDTPDKTGTGSEPAQEFRGKVSDREVPVLVLSGPLSRSINLSFEQFRSKAKRLETVCRLRYLYKDKSNS